MNGECGMIASVLVSETVKLEWVLLREKQMDESPFIRVNGNIKVVTREGDILSCEKY